MAETKRIKPTGWVGVLQQMEGIPLPFRFKPVTVTAFGSNILVYSTVVSPNGCFPLFVLEGQYNHDQIAGEKRGIILVSALPLAGKEVDVLLCYSPRGSTVTLLFDSDTLRPLAVFYADETSSDCAFFDRKDQRGRDPLPVGGEATLIREDLGGEDYYRVQFFLGECDMEAYLVQLGFEQEVARAWVGVAEYFYFQFEITPDGEITQMKLKAHPDAQDVLCGLVLTEVFPLVPENQIAQDAASAEAFRLPMEEIESRPIPPTLDLSMAAAGKEVGDAADESQQKSLIILLKERAYAATFGQWLGLSPDAQREILSGVDMELLWNWFAYFWKEVPQPQVIGFIKSLEVIPALEMLCRAVEEDKLSADLLVEAIAQDPGTAQEWGAFIEGQSFSVNQFLMLAALYPAGQESELQLANLLTQRAFNRFEKNRAIKDCAGKFPNLARMLQE